MNMQEFNDAKQASLNFAQYQTTHIETGIYKQKYPEYNYASLIPVDTDASDFAKSVTYVSMDEAGSAKWLNGNGKDVPLVGTSYEQHETQVHSAGVGYSYGFEEVNQARMNGVDLSADKAEVARRAYERHVYRVAFYGDTEKGFQGLFNYSGVPQASAKNDGAGGSGGSTKWTDKTPDQIIRDVNDALTGIHVATLETELANTVLIPTDRLNYIASTRLTDTSMTILDFIKKANVYTAQTGQPLAIMAKSGLENSGAGSTARLIAYRRARDVLKLHIPMVHRFFPVRPEGFQYTVPGMFRMGGLDIRLPKAFSYVDGI